MTSSHIQKLASAVAAAALLSAPALAEDAATGWTGEGSLSAGVSTGNTETTDLGLAVDATRDWGVWALGVQASADYGETDSTETRNRVFLGANLDRQINDKLFGFGSVSYEKDEFSGFASRTFIGGGLGYDIYDSDTLGWTVRGGPGLKIDEIEAVLDTTVVPATVITPETTEESLSAIAESNWRYGFNDNVGMTNDTKVLWADTSTQISNITALTAQLNGSLSARVSFEARHDTNPPLGFEDTDTISRVSLVYGFGK